LPTDAVVRRLERERGLGPWSAGVVCLEGLGRFEHGLVGDLGLVKLVRALRGRHAVETWETAELLEPYGEWAGLASVYLLAGFGRGLIPLPAARAA
jgi:3-methyladenine DNA glycosylase/8-oxoguanine DNA glycosylase